MLIKKEITIGQAISVALFVLGLVGSFYTLISRVNDLDKHVNDLYAIEATHITQREFADVKQDIRDIRNVLVNYVDQFRLLTPGGGQPRQRVVTPKLQYWNPDSSYTDSTHTRGARLPIFVGTDAARQGSH